MPGYNPIGIGNAPNDGLGDGGRTGAQKINAMLDEVFYTNFVKDDQWHVTRRVVTGGVLTGAAQTAWKVDDHVKGWVDNITKERWVEGVVLDDTIALPADVDDEAKFFITNQKIKAD